MLFFTFFFRKHTGFLFSDAFLHRNGTESAGVGKGFGDAFGLALADKELFLFLGAEHLRLRQFHGQGDAPAGMLHAPGFAHASLERPGFPDVKIRNAVVFHDCYVCMIILCAGQFCALLITEALPSYGSRTPGKRH